MSKRHCTTRDAENFFALIAQSEQSSESFPVDFDLVWPLAFDNRSDAKAALFAESEKGRDFHVHIVRVATQEQEIFLTVSFAEFFVAKRVDNIFDAYRASFALVAKGAK